MALQDYTKATILVNGVVLIEATSISVDHKLGNQPINTIEKGFAGISPGSSSIEVKIQSAVPRVGTDIDFTGLARARTLLDVVLFARAKKVKTKGYIMDVSESYGADKAAEISCTLMCAPPDESTL
jgi:hypothetical protein